MIWPLAQAYARNGYAVRRAGWNNPLIAPNTASPTGNQLRWITYHNALFYTAYQESVGSVITRVVRPTTNLDFTSAEFLAADWTILPVGCNGNPAATDQEGHLPYPIEDSDAPSLDPAFPNLSYGDCPMSPPGGLIPPGDVTPPIFPDNPLADPEDDNVGGGGGGGGGGEGGDPKPPSPGGGGGGGGGGSGDNSRRRNPPKPEAAPITVTIDPPFASCLNGEEAREVPISIRVSLGAAPSPAAEGQYWVTVSCNGQTERTSLSPGSTNDYVFMVSVVPGKTKIVAQATAYLPLRRLTSRDSLEAGPVPKCLGYYLTILCGLESCHEQAARLVVTGPTNEIVYQGCNGLGSVTIAQELTAGTTVELLYDENNACEYHCCDNAVFTILLSRSVEGVNPDAFVNLGGFNLNNNVDCGSRSATATITQGHIDTLNAP
jgi:hypothetical protein